MPTITSQGSYHEDPSRLDPEPDAQTRGSDGKFVSKEEGGGDAEADVDEDD